MDKVGFIAKYRSSVYRKWFYNRFSYRKTNPGGLDSRDQSRSRTSIVSRLTFENGRDYPSRRDQLL